MAITNQNIIYLDNNASTAVDDRVIESMLPIFKSNFGNAGSDHTFGWEANEVVAIARERIGELLNCKPSEFLFTSGATEAANIGILGFCRANIAKGKHIITVRTEHKAILEPIKALEKEGFTITYLNVDDCGMIDLQELDTAITDQTILVAIMLANNETGLIHPIPAIERIVHDKESALFCDITQAVGKINVDLDILNIDLAVFSTHKMHGPKGCGALYINRKNKLKLDSIFYGGGQEKGLRPGTLNVPAIVGFGTSAYFAKAELKDNIDKMLALRKILEANLEEIDGIFIHAKNNKRLPNTVNFAVLNIDGGKLLRRLNKIAVSRGSACNANTVEPSHVLTAMGFSKETTSSDIELAILNIKEAIYSLQKMTA
jgi:cysteine desulfurase